jgi:outer membrane usher protein
MAGPQSGAQAQERDLQLEVFINGASTGLVGAFKQNSDGSLTATPDEARAVGLKPSPEAIGADELVHLDRLPGVDYRLDDVGQRLFVTAPDAYRAPRIIDVSPRSTDQYPHPFSGYGAVLNYTLFGNTDGAFFRYPLNLRGVSGNFDARLFSPYGTVSQSFLANSAVRELGFVRLDTRWSYSDPDSLTTYRVGDTISGGLTWTRPVRLGGVQAQRNFALRPDLVTLPIPVLSGSAAVPSTLDVYTQNVKAYSGSAPAGPFEIINMPIASGAGTAQVVLRDALGREAVTTLPFYVSNKLLAEGLYDFSVEAGFVRRFSGVESNNYDRRPMGSGTFRYGLSEWLTVEAHAEGGGGLVNAGAGASFPIGSFGAGSFAVAGSRVGRLTGGLFNATFEAGFGGFTLYARSQRTIGDYRDIAAITADCAYLVGTVCSVPQWAGPWAPASILDGLSVSNILPPKAIDQIGLGIPVWFDSSSINLTFTQFRNALEDRTRVAGLSYSRSIIFNGTAFISAFKDFRDQNTFGVFAGVSFPLGDITLSSGFESAADGARLVASAMKAERHEEGSYGWRIRDAEGARSDRYASASYRAPFARVAASVEQYGAASRVTAEIDGSIAYAGGGIFFGNRIDDAFAVVDVGAPNVEVQHENRPVGRTNSQGMLLVPYLNSYQKNKLSIDPRDLPVDADVATTNEVVVPADRNGVVVKFGVSQSPRAALVIFVDSAGNPLRPGARGRLDGNGQVFVVGYDGQAYIRGLADQNAVMIDISEESACRAEFDYALQPGQQIVIRNVVCR